jgi:hypothetical protein
LRAADAFGAGAAAAAAVACRGVDLDQLLDMNSDELIELFHARARRRCEQRASHSSSAQQFPFSLLSSSHSSSANKNSHSSSAQH